MALTRRQVLASAAPAILTGKSRKPNLIWIMADDMGPGDLGCYGQKIIQTPNIDRLASEGTLFTQAYAGCTVCAPSRSVLMTGKHAGHTSIRSNPGGAPILDSDITVGEVLKGAGYATGCFGKWGLGDIGTSGEPWKQGFDEFVGFLHQAHAHFQYPQYIWDNDRKLTLEGNSDTVKKTFANDVMAERGIEFLRKRKDGPFFAYFPFTVPHAEHQAPAEEMDPYLAKVPGGPKIADNRKRFAPQPNVHAAYAGMVARLDRYVGKIAATLRELGLERNTLLIFTSDNGGAHPALGDDVFRSNLNLRGYKTTMYEGGLRVPMIARWPGKVAAGARSEFAWMFQDLMPTAAALAGVRAPGGIDGMNVMPTLLGKKQRPHEYLYWELPKYMGKTGGFVDEEPMAALRMGNWKAVRAVANAPLEIYDLQSDPTESRDLAGAQPQLVAKFTAKMKEVRVAPRVQTEPPHPWWDVRS
jgi:arylsulfatase A-like enzyme